LTSMWSARAHRMGRLPTDYRCSARKAAGALQALSPSEQFLLRNVRPMWTRQMHRVIPDSIGRSFVRRAEPVRGLGDEAHHGTRRRPPGRSGGFRGSIARSFWHMWAKWRLANLGGASAMVWVLLPIDRRSPSNG
jgi:hypothetical protein